MHDLLNNAVQLLPLGFLDKYTSHFHLSGRWLGLHERYGRNRLFFECVSYDTVF